MTIFIALLISAFSVHAEVNKPEKNLVSIDFKSKEHGRETFKITETLDVLNRKSSYSLQSIGKDKRAPKILKEQEAKGLVASINDFAWKSEYKNKFVSKKCTEAATVATDSVKTKICQEDRVKLTELIGIIGKIKSKY